MYKSSKGFVMKTGMKYTPQKAYLIIFDHKGDDAKVIKFDKNLTLGREVPGSTPDIILESPIISRKHGEFSVSSEGFFYKDNDSFNGTFINGKLYKNDVNPCSEPIMLKDGDVIRFDCRDGQKSHDNAVTIVFSTSYDKRSKWRKAKFAGSSLSVGISNIGLIETDISKIMVQLVLANVSGHGCTITKTTKANNVFYNNVPVYDNAYIRNKDVFRVNQNFVYYNNGEVLYSICLVDAPGLEVHLAETYVTDKLKKKVLLKDIHLNVDKGDFALIIGGSGAGKSTFVNSILGKYDIVGNVLVGGRLATGNSEVTSDIAYVPQTLPLRKEERLIDVVTDTCVLRCKRKMSGAERKKFISDTLDSLGLKSKAKTEIRKLSGGEQRRAAIANEVVTDSSIFFLDEPDSGLDPKSGMELMNNLKNLSDIGKIVMLISHNYASYPNPEKIYTKIIILAKSNRDGIGRLAFCGSVTEALEFFGVEELKDITKLINPVSENGDGRADEFVEKYERMRRYE